MVSFDCFYPFIKKIVPKFNLLADKITDKKAQLCKKARALIETLKEDHKSLQERIKKETDAKKAALLKELDRILQVIQDKVQYYADKYFCNQNNLDLASLVKSLQHILH